MTRPRPRGGCPERAVARRGPATPDSASKDHCDDHFSFWRGSLKRAEGVAPASVLSGDRRCVTARLPKKILVSPPQPARSRRKRNALSPLDGTGGLAAAQGR